MVPLKEFYSLFNGNNGELEVKGCEKREKKKVRKREHKGGEHEERGEERDKDRVERKGIRGDGEKKERGKRNEGQKEG